MNLSQCVRPLLRLFGNFFFHRQLLFNGATLKSSCHFTHAAWMRRQENLTLNGEIEMMMAVSNLLLPIAHIFEISRKCNFGETRLIIGFPVHDHELCWSRLMWIQVWTRNRNDKGGPIELGLTHVIDCDLSAVGCPICRQTSAEVKSHTQHYWCCGRTHSICYCTILPIFRTLCIGLT